MYPNYQWLQLVSEYMNEQEQIMQEEQERKHQAEQEEIIINDYFIFATKIGKINYARGCAWGYEKPSWSTEKQKRVRCSPKSYDCGWAMKAYLVAKGITNADGIAWLNSSALYDMGTPKDPRTATRGDFMYRKWYWDNATGNLSTHFAVVSRPYDGHTMWIYDNVVPGWADRYNERAISISCNSTVCHYMGKYRIYVATNWAIQLAKKNNVEVTPWIDTSPDSGQVLQSIPDTNNPLWFSVTIKGYAYDSEANRIASWWYNHSSWDVDMISTFICENWGFNPKSVSHTNDYWLCQLHYNSTNARWIDDKDWFNIEFQQQACLDKRQAVANKNARACYAKRDKFKSKVLIMTK